MAKAVILTPLDLISIIDASFGTHGKGKSVFPFTLFLCSVSVIHYQHY